MNSVLYMRFSPRRNAEDCESIEVQREKCSAYCKAMGYTVVGEFFDKAKSGKDRLRDGLDQAIKSAQENQAVLVVRDLSRVSRDVRDMLDIRGELIDRGAGLVDLETRTDTAGPAGKMIYTIIASVKQYQREETSAKTSEAILWKQSNGQKVSSQCPYGWRDGDKFQRGEKQLTKIVPDSSEQSIVQRIVKMKADGLGYKAIATALNDEKVPARGKMWYGKSIRKIVLAQGNGQEQN